MKLQFITLLAVLCYFNCSAQVLLTPDSFGLGKTNVDSFNTAIQTNKFSITRDYTTSTVDPATNEITMTNGSLVEVFTESGIIKDPAGDGDYLPGINFSAGINLFNVPNSIGYEITFTQLDTEIDGDSVLITNWVSNSLSDRSNVYYSFSGSSLPKKITVYDNDFNIIFVSDADANVGSGFELEFRAIYAQSSDEENITIGNSLDFNPENGAFFAGHSEGTFNPGTRSVSLGSSKSLGSNSVAIGLENKALSDQSFALGTSNTVSGPRSFAVGEVNRVVGIDSYAFGSANKVNVTKSYSFGFANEVDINNSFLVGIGNKTTDSSFITGAYSFGFLNENYGEGAFTLGARLIAKSSRSVVVGYFNDDSDSPAGKFSNKSFNDRIFQVGNGIRGVSGTPNKRQNALTILANGNIGTFNTVDPKANLHLKYTSDLTWDAHLRLEYTSNAYGNIVYDFDGFKFRAWGTGDDFYFRNAANTTVARINDDGNMTIGGTLTQNSDKRLKTNIVGISNSLIKLSRLNGYHYNWIAKDKDQTLQTGLIAQEIQQVFPELVHKDEQGILSVNYTGLIPHLLEAVKELNKENKELKATLSQLTATKEQNNARLAKLEEIIFNTTSEQEKAVTETK